MRFHHSNQCTIETSYSCSGIGLHSGEDVNVLLKPSKIDAGIRFIRSDINNDDNVIHALSINVINTTLCTMLSNNSNIKVRTIEHLMAALHSYGITNLDIEVDSEEMPIMDGSAEPWMFALASAGVIEQNKNRTVIEITKDITVESDDKKSYIKCKPYDGLIFDVYIDFPHLQNIGQQRYEFDASSHSFKSDISRARTFCFERDLKKLKAANLGLGGSLSNSIVLINDGSALNKEGMRYADELVRHKTLDLIGDLYLCGCTMKGKITAHRMGHSLNDKFVKLLLQKGNHKIIAL